MRTSTYIRFGAGALIAPATWTCIRFGAGVLIAPAILSAAKVTADLQPPQKRQNTVALAEQLAERKLPAPLPADLPSPFNPPDFEKPDGTETQTTLAVTRSAPSTSNARGAATPPPAPIAPPGDREILDTLAAQLTPTGTIQISGAPRLVMGSKRFEVGTRFTVIYNNQDYELELVAIDRTTFTLRYRGEETTRPIKTVR